MPNLIDLLTPSAPALLLLALAVTVSALGLAMAHWLLFVREVGTMQRLTRQIVMLVLTIFAIFSPILALVVNADTREAAGVLVALVGLAFSVTLTVSSTTFMSNAMAGLMLRAVRNFKPGDFVRVGDYFGRVTERGLFHVEIQTEDRDLATLPNMFLVSQPVKVVRESGTIVSADLSLGYDVPHGRVEALLRAAAEATGLEKPFVYLLDLGNFSVTYRVAGFLPKVEHLLSVRSALRGHVLDTLHQAGIEIVSPTFQNQRRLPEHAVVVPEHIATPASPPPASASAPEDIMFDKAQYEERLESLRSEQGMLAEHIKDLEGQLAKADQASAASLETELQNLRRRRDRIDAALQPTDDGHAGAPDRKA